MLCPETDKLETYLSLISAFQDHEGPLEATFIDLAQEQRNECREAKAAIQHGNRNAKPLMQTLERDAFNASPIFGGLHLVAAHDVSFDCQSLCQTSSLPFANI